jgi:hypothetical protein
MVSKMYQERRLTEHRECSKIYLVDEKPPNDLLKTRKPSITLVIQIFVEFNFTIESGK